MSKTLTQKNNFMSYSPVFPVKHDPKVRSLKDTVINYQYSYAPEEFQRPESWAKNDRKSYFQSILMNRLEGSFVFADLQLAIKKLEKLAPTDRAYNFFVELFNQGIEYIILDGNNRYKFLSILMNDEYQIPRGTYNYVIEDDTLTLVVGSHNNVFSKLPKIVQKAIRDRQLVISEYVQIDYTGLSDVFTNVNSGVPLNHQEKRNAMDSPWADWIRQIRGEIIPLLITMFGPNYHSRLKGDEWIVQSLDFAINCAVDDIKGVGQASMNRLYKSDITDIDKQFLLETFIELADYINVMISDDNFTFGNKTDKVKVLSRGSTVMNLYWMMVNGINTYEEVCAAVIDHEKSYKDSSFINDDGNNYVWACGGLGAKNNEMKMKVLANIMEYIEQLFHNLNSIDTLRNLSNKRPEDQKVRYSITSMCYN